MAEESEMIIRRETLTPPSSVESNYPGLLENGYQGQSSDESGSEMNCDEAPLDFSVRKRSDSIDDLGSDGNGEIHSRNSESGSQSAGESSTASTGTETPPQHLVSDRNQARNKAQPLSPNSRAVNGLKPEDFAGKIGEPPLVLPFGVPGAVFPGLNAFPPGFNAAAAAATGILPNAAGMLGALPLAPGMVENRKVQNQNNSKPTRPFKAYPKDPLSLPLGYYGIPGMLPGITLPNFDPSMAQTMNTEDLFNQYRMLLKNQRKNGKAPGSKAGENSVASGDNGVANDEQAMESPVSPGATSSNASQSPQPNVVSSQQPLFVSTSPPTTHSSPTKLSPLQPPPGPFTSPSSIGVSSVKYQLNSQPPTPRKKPKLLPDEKKDQAYWERRRKNNDAAKRSRDARRAKEDEIAIRAAFLEQENLKLRVEVAALKNETAKLRCMLYNS